MRKNISFKTYRLIDLFILTVLLVVSEIIASKALGWFNEKFYISLFLSLSLIVLMRWNAWASVTIIAGTLTYCIINQGVLQNFITYLVGNLFLLFNLFWFIKGKKQFKKNYIVFLYIVTGYLLIEIGRSLVALFYDANFFSALIGFLGTDVLNCLLAILIIFIMKRQDGVFEDQVQYLNRVSDQKASEPSDLEVKANEKYH